MSKSDAPDFVNASSNAGPTKSDVDGKLVVDSPDVEFLKVVDAADMCGGGGESRTGKTAGLKRKERDGPFGRSPRMHTVVVNEEGKRKPVRRKILGEDDDGVQVLDAKTVSRVIVPGLPAWYNAGKVSEKR